MLKLINIKHDKDTIEADYVPEDGSEKAHVSLSKTSKKGHADVIEEYGTMYSRMAINGLKRTLDELNSGAIKEIPNERVVMWY